MFFDIQDIITIYTFHVITPIMKFLTFFSPFLASIRKNKIAPKNWKMEKKWCRRKRPKPPLGRRRRRRRRRPPCRGGGPASSPCSPGPRRRPAARRRSSRRRSSQKMVSLKCLSKILPGNEAYVPATMLKAFKYWISTLSLPLQMNRSRMQKKYL